MSNHLGPLTVDCDAPPYAIVVACSEVGFDAPADVRWCRLSHLRERRTGWGKVLGFNDSTTERCHCGHALPHLETYIFTLSTGKELSYQLGQCHRCHAIYWE